MCWHWESEVIYFGDVANARRMIDRGGNTLRERRKRRNWRQEAQRRRQKKSPVSKADRHFAGLTRKTATSTLIMTVCRMVAQSGQGEGTKLAGIIPPPIAPEDEARIRQEETGLMTITRCLLPAQSTRPHTDRRDHIRLVTETVTTSDFHTPRNRPRRASLRKGQTSAIQCFPHIPA